MSVLQVYADGGVIQKNPSAIGGTWASCHVDGHGQRIWSASGVILPEQVGGEVTNNQTEFYALLMGLEATPMYWSGQACSDSRVTLLRFFYSGALRGIPEGWQRRMGRLLERLRNVEPVQLDGHPTRAQLAAGVGKRGQKVSEFNVWCDLQCGEEARKFLAQREAVPA